MKTNILLVLLLVAIGLLSLAVERRQSHKKKCLAERAHLLIGREVEVEWASDISRRSVRVRIDGHVWRAKESGCRPLGKGDHVRVVGAQDLILLVEKL